MTASLRPLLRAKAGAIGAAGFVPSPCLSVCRMDGATGLCEGCLRTLDEIAAWSALGEEDKRAVWQQIAKRALEALP